jgi:ribonuclease VapC
VIVDTSAVLAVLFGEEDAPAFAEAIAGSEVCRMSAANLLEAGINIDSQAGPAAGRQLDLFVQRADLLVEPVTFEQVQIARQAYLDFGKGNHPAGLNFGDCFAYALATALDESLLFKGDDFGRTDVRPYA